MNAFVSRLAPAQILLWLFFLSVLVFLTFPLLVVIPESFSPTAVIEFPPRGFSWRWYQEFFKDSFWTDSLWLSVKLGLVVAVLSTALGLMAAVALNRFLHVGKGLIRVLVLSPLIVPVIVVAIGLFEVMSKLHLVGSFWGLVLSHTILALPFPFVILDNALRRVDRNLEDAAVSLGASRFRAFHKVAVPLIMPSILGAALFAFLASWDEVVIVLFVGGVALQTLPVKMFQFLTTEVRPTVGAVSALLIGALFLTLLAMGLAGRVKRSWRRPATLGDP